VRKGFLEASNVDTAEQLTRMIRSQRAYQVAARAITTADQMEEITNNIMR
jgi:flagellar basal-body rod protein FlgG